MYIYIDTFPIHSYPSFHHPQKIPDKDPASLGNSFPRKGRTNDSPNQHLGIEGLPLS